MANMIEAASQLRPLYKAEQVSWPRYVLNSAMGIAVFGVMLWVAS
ncbi:hypothetical protein [Pseudomonas sp.]|nr:hypothetical protein [Pseudomonas sp.]